MKATAESLTAYVYFRTDPADAEAARQALARQHALVLERLGIVSRSELRHDRDKGYLTWLEIYPGITRDALDHTLQRIEQAAVDSGVSALALQARHHEVFAPLSAH